MKKALIFLALLSLTAANANAQSHSGAEPVFAGERLTRDAYPLLRQKDSEPDRIFNSGRFNLISDMIICQSLSDLRVSSESPRTFRKFAPTLGLPEPVKGIQLHGKDYRVPSLYQHDCVGPNDNVWNLH